MPTYLYWARDDSGKHQEGQVDAPSEDSAITQLSSKGIYVTRIKDAATVVDGKDFIVQALGIGRPKLEDLLLFSQQMSTMLKAGVPINRCMSVMLGSTQNEKLRQTLVKIGEDLEAGRSLSSCLQEHRKIFPQIVISMVHVGESTGSLDRAFEQVSFYIQNEIDTRRRIKSATRYPMFVILSVVVAIAVINVFVIPAFEKFFAKFSGELPWATKLLLATSEFTVKWWPLLLFVIIGSVVAFMLYIRSEKGEIVWGRWQLKFPLVGRILEQATLARLCRSFAMTVSAGVPMLQALTTVAKAVDNAYVSSKIFEMRRALERGESLVAAAKHTNLFTPLVMQMITIGEETGEVDTMMQNVADTYETEVDYALKGLSEAIEPILISVIAVIVLILALGIFLPMWDLSSVAMKDMQGGG